MEGGKVGPGMQCSGGLTLAQTVVGVVQRRDDVVTSGLSGWPCGLSCRGLGQEKTGQERKGQKVSSMSMTGMTDNTGA